MVLTEISGIASPDGSPNGEIIISPAPFTPRAPILLSQPASQIVDAIEKKKWRVYITHRWWIIAKLMKWMPDFIYHRIG